MIIETAFVGDIHGNLPALNGIRRALADRGVAHAVFLGDYIDKGPYSADVLRQLISLADEGRATLLAGNHERVLLQALDSGNLAPFLKIGGAATILSYVAHPI